MNIKTLFIVTAAGITLAACHSNTYEIKGTAENMQDGDTLFLTTDMVTGIPSDTLVVKNGKFSLSGSADSTCFCMLYSAKAHQINATFFRENGNIDIRLSAEPSASRVGGTPCNNEWQRLNDSLMVVGKAINLIAERIYAHPVTPAEREKGMKEIEELNKQFSNKVEVAAERNIDNEFGYFLILNFSKDLFSATTTKHLISQMPKELRQRTAIQQMEQELTKQSNTAEGSVMPDFTLPDAEGNPVSALAEIKKHKLTVIDFWASWCGPCRREMPSVISLYESYKDKGLGILGVSLDNNKDAWTNAIKQWGTSWPQVSDLKGWESSAATLFNVKSIPCTVIVDQEGKILRRDLRDEQLRNFVADYLK